MLDNRVLAVGKATRPTDPEKRYTFGKKVKL